MSEPTTPVSLKKAMEDTGGAWLLEYWGDERDRRLAQAAEAVEEFITEYQRRFGEKPDPFALSQQNPPLARGFFQVDTFEVSLEMRILIWRILLGCEIVRVKFDYDFAGTTSVAVSLRTPYGEEEVYRSEQANDFRVLRHFGAITSNGRLILQGYYGLK